MFHFTIQWRRGWGFFLKIGRHEIWHPAGTRRWWFMSERNR